MFSTVAFFSTAFARFVISPIAPSIRAEFAIKNTIIGIALTGMWFAYGGLQYPSGVLAGPFSERQLILIAIGGTAASLFIAVAPVFWLFVVATVVIGGVSGLHFSVAATLLSRRFENTGVVLGLHNAGGSAAGFVAPVVATAVGVVYGGGTPSGLGSRSASSRSACSRGGSGPPNRKILPSRSADSSPSTPSRDPVVAPILFSMALATICMFVLQANVSFLPTFLVEHRGYSQSYAGLVFSAYFVAQGVLQVGVGSLSDPLREGQRHRAVHGRGRRRLSPLSRGLQAVSLGGRPVLLGIGLSSQVAVMSRTLEELPGTEKTPVSVSSGPSTSVWPRWVRWSSASCRIPSAGRSPSAFSSPYRGCSSSRSSRTELFGLGY